jgi:hypothetical protein
MSTNTINPDFFYLAGDIFDKPVSVNESEERKIFKEVSDLDELEKSIERSLNIKNHLPEVADRDVYFTSTTVDYSSKTNNHIQVQALTGKLTEHEIPNDASPELRENLKRAREIINYVHNKVPFSSNYFQRSKIFNPEYSDSNSFIEFGSIIDTSFKILKQKKEVLIKTSPVGAYKSYVEQIIELKTGNCEEMCLVGADYGKKLGIQVESYEIVGGDHAFLAIGNSPHKVICDVWTEAYYPESKAKQYLMDFVYTIKDANIQYTLVSNFDSGTQTISKKRLGIK